MEQVMRLIGAALLACAALVPAAVAAPKANPPTGAPAAAQAKPAPGTPRAVYAAMPESERRAIQSDLIWSGDYNGLIDRDFGDASIAAVKAFQKRNGGKETGILNPDERAKLAESAHQKRQRAGWHVVDDRATGARVGLPDKFVPQASQAGTGTRWQSSRGEVRIETFRVAAPGTTLAAVFERTKKEPANREIEYQALKPEFFVVSGMQGGVKKFYVRAEVKGAEVRGITVLYDKAMEGIFDPIVVAVSNAFSGFPAGQIASGPAPRRTVEYATGIVVSASGHILTGRGAVDDCQFVVIPGLGNAQRIAEDQASDLALLRVFGARDLAPATLAELSGGSDVTLVGIADPQAQDGGSAISTVRARVLAANGSARPLEPMPAAGFSGAAAIDADAKLLGMVDVRTPSGGASAQAALIPAETIRTFLYAQSVAPANGGTGLDGVKASLVRVICVRK